MAGVGALFLLVITSQALVNDLLWAPRWWAGATAVMAASVLVAVVCLGLSPVRFPVKRLMSLWRALSVGGLALALIWSVTMPTPERPWIFAFISSFTGFAAVSWRWFGATAYVAAFALATTGLAMVTGSPAAPVLWDDAALNLANVGFVAIFQGVRHQFTQLRVASMEAVKQRVAQARVQSEVVERERVNALIHDDVLSALQAIVGAPTSPQTRDQAGRASQMLATFAVDVRRPRASTVDLVPLVGAVVSEAEPVTRVEVRDAVVVVPYDVADALMAAAREALRNTARHAGAGAAAQVSLTRVRSDGASTIVLMVSDDGIGYAQESVDPRRMGVSRTIMERVPRLGGTVDITSAPGSGTRVVLSWGER